MLKKSVCLFICFVVFSYMSIFAEKSDKVYTEYKFYTASIYVCDPENNEIVLRNVEPENRYVDGFAGAMSIEYNAIGINSGCIFNNKGEALSFDVVNEYLLDVKATVLVGKNKNEKRVLYVGF